MDEQGITPVMPPRPGRPERRPPRGHLARRRAIAAALLVGFLAIVLYVVFGLRGGDAEVQATTPTVTTAPKPVILKILFPEGFTRKDMVKRVAEVRQIAKTKRKVTPKLSGNAYAVASKAAKVPVPFRKHARGIEGFLFPATYEFTPKTTAKQLVEDQIDHFNGNWAKVDQRYAKKKKLTPYDVLIIASMVEKETIAPDERPKVAAVIYNRLKARMPLGIDATIRYGLDIPGHRIAACLAAREQQPVQHPEPPRPAADSDRESGTRLDAGRRAPGEGQVPLLRPQARPGASLLHGQ